jgi:hypothetical protein
MAGTVAAQSNKAARHFGQFMIVETSQYFLVQNKFVDFAFHE